MIDTLGLKIVIPKATYNKMLSKLTRTQRIAQKTGEVKFEYYNHTIQSAWDYKINIKVTDEYWAYNERYNQPFRNRGIYQICLEFSVPKLLYGHNLVSADISLMYDALHKVKKALEDELKIKLPDPAEWYCCRVDTCANFILENEGQVRNYLIYLQRLDYPRRLKNSYDDTGLYFRSRYNTLKIYCKGAEFRKHDMKRFPAGGEAEKRYRQAQRIIRIEVEQKKRIKAFFKTLENCGAGPFIKFQGYPKIKDLIAFFDIKKEMEVVVSKIFCGTETKIMKSMNVFGVLREHYSDQQARSYHQIYMMIVGQGQKSTKKSIGTRTYYRATAAFRKCGISLIATDMANNGKGLDKDFPSDFTLAMNEGNRYYQVPLTELLSKAA